LLFKANMVCCDIGQSTQQEQSER